jgi:hypothetical protein
VCYTPSLNRVVVFIRNRDGIKARAEFLTAEERGLVIPWFTLLTNRNMMITTTDQAGKITINSTRNITSSICKRQGGRS